ncbi:MAG TPA: cupin domain-containing protein [Candidatus Competibacteraceae bacterium]|nr:cupin domain-containing protein [Candidatus Competibacteraceae bacterium]
MPPKSLLGGLTPEQFLRDYWQKQPLLIRSAFPGFQDPITPEELAGLACEEQVQSRLVLEQGGSRPWELRRGPFAEEEFLKLPESHWTLLVSDVEKHLPQLQALLEPFRFIPDWRIDDLQISYAPVHGSVGPHWDDYDVLLLQGKGRRRWRISHRPVAEDNVLPDVDLRIMGEFQADEDWVLEPGDMLYLPPRLAHYGTALEPALTYSIGFRAPGHRELVHSFLDFLGEGVEDDGRYTDPDLRLQDHPARIAPEAVRRARDLLARHIGTDSALVESWLGRFLTEPKPYLAAQPMEEPWDAAELDQFLDQAGTLERHPGSRFAFIEHADEILLFIDGQEFALGPPLKSLATWLCREHVYPAGQLCGLLKHAAARALILDLVNEGYLVSYDDEREDDA